MEEGLSWAAFSGRWDCKGVSAEYPMKLSLSLSFSFPHSVDMSDMTKFASSVALPTDLMLSFSFSKLRWVLLVLSISANWDVQLLISPLLPSDRSAAQTTTTCRLSGMSVVVLDTNDKSYCTSFLFACRFDNGC